MGSRRRERSEGVRGEKKKQATSGPGVGMKKGKGLKHPQCGTLGPRKLRSDGGESTPRGLERRGEKDWDPKIQE